MDPVALAQALIARPSVTPADAGAQDVLADALAPLGFHSRRLRFGAIDNLVAHRPGRGPRLAFAGHSDVVPTGPEEAWADPPFAAQVRDGRLYGRGAADMKGAIAAFVAAAARRISGGHDDELLLIITGDEEGEAVDGTARLMPWIAGEGLTPAAALVGEPTSAAVLGDTIKIGRRGSTNMVLTVEGTQGHVAYPARADNPVTRLVRILADLKHEPLDHGTEAFEASNLEVVSLAAGEGASNVIPAAATAKLNIRFNPLHSGASLEERVRHAAETHAERFSLDARCSGEAFLTEPGPLTAMLGDAIRAVTGVKAALSTGGGTSDARFIRAWCPVVEFGLPGATMHKVDERVAVDDLLSLTDIYAAFLERWFR